VIHTPRAKILAGRTFKRRPQRCHHRHHRRLVYNAVLGADQLYVRSHQHTGGLTSLRSLLQRRKCQSARRREINGKHRRPSNGSWRFSRSYVRRCRVDGVLASYDGSGAICKPRILSLDTPIQTRVGQLSQLRLTPAESERPRQVS